MRILFVTNMYPTPERPAYGAFVWQQAEQLRQFGHTVDVVNILGFKSKFNYLKAAVEVLRRTHGTAYDVVHAHYSLSAFPAWFRRRAPLVLTLHGGDLLGGSIERVCTRLIWRFADAVIVVSEELRRRIPGKIIPCGVDLSIFTPRDRDEARARLGWPREKVVILFPFDPSRPVKRWDLARAAVEHLTLKGTPAELVSVFQVENREMPWYYSAADAMLLCSDREGSPTSVKEALACGLPVVATDVGDLRDVLTGVPGTQVSKQDVQALARSLHEVLEGHRTGGTQRRAAVAQYDQAATIQKIVRVYDSVRVGLRVSLPASVARTSALHANYSSLAEPRTAPPSPPIHEAAAASPSPPPDLAIQDPRRPHQAGQSSVGVARSSAAPPSAASPGDCG